MSLERRPRRGWGRGRADRLACAALAFALALACAAGPAAAQPRRAPRAPSSQLSGTYRFAGSPEEGQAIIRAAFEEALDQVSPILRPFVRKAMNDRDWLVRSITIASTPDRISFRAVSYKVFAITTEPGVTETVTSRRGRETQVTQQLLGRGRQLEQVLENSRGQQRNVLTLEDGGRTLVAQTTFTSRFLERPVSFELRYERVEPPRRPDRATQGRRGRPGRVRSRRRPPIRVSGVTPVQLRPVAGPIEPAPAPEPQEPVTAPVDAARAAAEGAPPPPVAPPPDAGGGEPPPP